MRVFILILAVCAYPAPSPAAARKIAFLVAQAPSETLTAESHTASELARRIVAAEPLRVAGDGKVVDVRGRPVSLDRFEAIWFHGEDPAGPAAPTVAALRRYVAQGRGLLLSGTAARLVVALGAGRAETRPLTFGHDRAQAGLVPLRGNHPAFRGADLERGTLWMSNAVYPAFARFHPAALPPGGAILARTPGGPENPLVEYALGRGRVIALAWRLSPHYHAAPGALRANFEGLTVNLLTYLADDRAPRSLPPDATPAAVSPDEWRALAMAIDDLIGTFGSEYPRGEEFRERLRALETVRKAELPAAFRRLRSEALLANPLLDFDRLLLVKRGAEKLGLPTNYQSNSSLEPTGYDNEIAVLSPVRPAGRLATLFRPPDGVFVGDVDLDFDALRLLFSMPSAGGRWRIFEIDVGGSEPRELPLIDEADVDNYDACYLPDDRIIFTSTAPFTGVPCVRGSAHVANLYLLETDGRIRRLTVEQDHDWCPTVMPDGRILYLRWEYTDLPHAFSRILFHMNPDGTAQMAYYGSNSYWPASMFYARPVPGDATKFVAVVGGHHDRPRMGDLVLFDTAKGRFEAQGAVQRIPGHGRRVEPVLLDLPIEQSWPKFLHPYPLSDTYFLVSCQLGEGEPWSIYVADIFDNLELIYEEPGYAMLEPIPLRESPRPPALPDRINPAEREAEVFLADVYAGPGLAGVPRGTIKALRIIGYHFAYQGVGGEPDAPGLDGPWDVKQIVGTVPVEEDGSAHFRIPAYRPIAVQPLDAEGKAVQQMRSWFTAMPGEVLSCVGCHEGQNAAPPGRTTRAARRPADEIRPWYGPARGFDFRREVQPVLDRYCVGCHDGREDLDLTDGDPVPTMANSHPYNLASRFTPSYFELRKRVRTPTRESDMHLLAPWEFHADTTRLVQMLRKGHRGVRLDEEAWDRLVTWIDLGAPAHGSWTTICGAERVGHQAGRRRAMRRRYIGLDEDPESLPAREGALIEPVIPTGEAATEPAANLPGWPFEADEARRRQRSRGGPHTLAIPLDEGIRLELVRIPAGAFVMGQADGSPDEHPLSRVAIEAPYWMSRFEITNEEFALFDPSHESGLEHGDYIQFSPGERGWTLGRPKQPVVRVAWREAVEFCRWLSRKTGRRFALPTEAQWEYACRAGTATPLWYGRPEANFAPFANLSDAAHQAIDPFGWSGRTQVIPPWRPAAARVNDRSRVSAPAGTYEANPWGLSDMHGNVSEWTRSAYRPYPYREEDGRNDPSAGGRRVVRGGSWYDPPARGRSAFRQSYLPDQGVYDVGFRVVCGID